MKVHIPRLCLDGKDDLPVDRLEILAGIDRVRVHQLTRDVSAADLYLFPQCHMRPSDWRLSHIRRHPLTVEHWGQVLVYNERPRPWCAMPGVYVSMPKEDFDARYQRA